MKNNLSVISEQKNGLEEAIQEISDNFSLGDIREVSKLEGGIVNVSYKVLSNQGNFVIQRLSNIFSPEVINDYQTVQRFLRTNDLHVPVLLTGKNSLPFLQKEGLWRVFEYINHDEEPSMTEFSAYEVGKTLGKFHEIMSKSDFHPTFQIPGFHNTKAIIKKLDNTVENAEKKRKEVILEEYNFIKREIAPLYLSDNLPRTIIHGDPKMANFLFKNGKVISVLDLDTMMPMNELIDIGDALRSWCRHKKDSYNPDIFYSSIEGYRNQHKISYSNSKIKDAMKLITLELCARFLIDSYEEKYFSFDSDKYKSLAEQNLERTRLYLSYYKNFNLS